MPAKKIRDVTVKTGEYTDRNTGETKGRWQNVGSLMQNEDDGSFFVVLDRTFNPAGVPNPDSRSSLILSCFIPQDQWEGQNGQRQGGTTTQQRQEPQRGGHGEIEDEIPF